MPGPLRGKTGPRDRISRWHIHSVQTSLPGRDAIVVVIGGFMKDRAAYQAAGASQQTVESSGTPHLPSVALDKDNKDTDKARAKKTSPPSGLTFPRFFTEAGIDPFDEVEWELRAAVIGSESGNVVFEQRDVEIPKSWSQQATNIVVSKYFRGQIGTPERERSVRQLIGRVVDTITEWGRNHKY